VSGAKTDEALAGVFAFPPTRGDDFDSYRLNSRLDRFHLHSDRRPAGYLPEEAGAAKANAFVPLGHRTRVRFYRKPLGADCWCHAVAARRG